MPAGQKQSAQKIARKREPFLEHRDWRGDWRSRAEARAWGATDDLADGPRKGRLRWAKSRDRDQDGED